MHSLRKQLSWLPVAIILLALLAIFSTWLPTAWQQHPAALGMPMILWFWLGIAVLSVVLTTVAAWHVTRGARGGHRD